MKVQSLDPRMRAFVLGTFVVDGVVAVWMIASIAFGDGRIEAFDALVIAALLLGFFTALGVIIESREEEDPARNTVDVTDAVN